MNLATEKEFYKNHRIEIHYDENPNHPIRDFDYMSTFVCWNNRYNLGHKHEFDSPEDFQLFVKENQIPIVVPLYVYIHSGITISTGSFSDVWDSGQVGWAYISKETILKEYGSLTEENIKKAQSVLEAEVKEYDCFMTGDVYGYKIIDEETDEEYESCWGFSGYDSIKEMIEECKSIIDNRLKTIAEGLPEAVLI